MTPAPAWMTADALVLAKVLWDEGLSCAQIAFRCHTTKHSIVGLAHRRAWPPRPSPIGRTKDEARHAVARVPEGPHHKASAPKRDLLPSPKPQKPVVVAEKRDLRVACKPERLAVPTASFSGCQWINGGNRRTWKMCGCPTVRGPWCAEHLAVVYVHRSALAAA